MGSNDVIADVSEILVRVLTDAVQQPNTAPVVQLVDLVGRQPGANGSLGLQLFLYEVAEDTSARNRGPRNVMVQDPVTGVVRQERRRAAVALVLRYLLIPVGGDPVAQQRMLGRAVQALYDDAILQGPLVTLPLGNSVAEAGESLKLRLAPLSLDERAKVWWAISQPYRLSLNYEVRVVNVDSGDVSARPTVSEALVGIDDSGGQA